MRKLIVSGFVSLDDAVDKALLQPVDSKVFDSGVTVHTYHPVRDE